MERIGQYAQVWWQDFLRCKILQHAYAMAYVSLLSLIPSLSALLAVLTLFSPLLAEDSNFVEEIRNFILSHLTTGSGEEILSYLESFISNLDLNKIGLTGFVGTLITLVLLLRQIEIALNSIFQIYKPRNLVTRFVNFWTFTTLGAFSLALFLTTLSSYETAGLSELWKTVSSWFNKLIMVLLFSLIYKLIPNCKVKIGPALMGGVFATVLLSLAGKLFQAYIVLFTNYQAIYGAALAALPTFLLWLYIIWVIVLLGALVTWRMQQGFRWELTNRAVSLQYPPAVANEIKYHLPPIILLKCYDDFQENNGQGCSLDGLAKDLELPLYWIEEAVETLDQNSMILRCEDHEEVSRVHIKIPPDKLSLKSFDETFHKQAQSFTGNDYLGFKERLRRWRSSPERALSEANQK